MNRRDVWRLVRIVLVGAACVLSSLPLVVLPMSRTPAWLTETSVICGQLGGLLFVALIVEWLVRRTRTGPAD